MSANFGVLACLTLTWFSKEMLISNICIRGFMCSAIKNFWKVSIHTAHWLLHRVPKKEEKAAETKNESLNFGVNWCNARRRQPRSWTDPELHSVLFYKKCFHNYRNKTFWSTVCLFYLGFGLFVLLHTYFGVNWCNTWWRQPRSWTNP